ncbi:MAG: DEAD/DEAH box helicase, partial [Clostridia bacterium]|nr:DEAD/DEAH box helicase [Clostridia bacterium]
MIASSFEEMELSPRLLSAIEAMGFEQPTEIQARAVPLIRTGQDVIGRSQTGTGKTVAFAIPALERIDPDDENVQILILCPTRELAQQGCEQIKKLCKFMMHIYPVDVYGGAAMERQIQRLKKANLVIGTPGRIMDHMRRRTLKLDHVKMVVLDEADEMLSMGFREDIETILREIPEERQTVLFSATMPPEILALTEEFQRDPQMIEVNREQITLDAIAQSYVEVPMGRKKDALCLLLHAYAPARAMIFCNTKALVDEVTAHLITNGFFADGLHGDLQQSQRNKVMDAFRAGRIQVLVATDVAARGIDVSGVDYVFNYDVPQDPEYYVHRIGRTGRAGHTGTAITICSGRRQIMAVGQLAKMVRSDIPRGKLPTVGDAAESMAERAVTEIEAVLADTVQNGAYQWVQRLCDKGYDLKTIAAAALQLHYGVSEPGKDEAFASAEQVGGYVRLSLSIGRSSRVAPNHLVAAVAERTGIPGKDIGKIEIYDDFSIVEVPAGMEEFCIAELVGTKICGKPIHCEIAGESETDWDNRPGKGAKPAKGRRPGSTSRLAYSSANTRSGKRPGNDRRPGANRRDDKRG